MRRRFSIGLAIAVLFTLGNVAGGVYAGMMGEVRHAGLHMALALLGAFGTWAIIARRRANGDTPQLAAAGGSPSELSSRLTNLEQSLDAIAVEVERVGEGQRFMTRLFTRERTEQKDRK